MQTITIPKIIQPADLDRIRAHPEQFAAVFQNYAASLRTMLGAAFAGLTNDGLMAVFASIAAYELAPYRSALDPLAAPPSLSLHDLLAEPLTPLE